LSEGKRPKGGDSGRKGSRSEPLRSEKVNTGGREKKKTGRLRRTKFRDVSARERVEQHACSKLKGPAYQFPHGEKGKINAGQTGLHWIARVIK